MSAPEESDKRMWAEKKRSGKTKERQAAASVQAARILGKLLDRSRGKGDIGVQYPTKVLELHSVFSGAGTNNKASLERRKEWYSGEGLAKEEGREIGIASGNIRVKPRFRPERTERTAVITDSTWEDYYEGGGRRYLENELVLDPEGKRRPAVFTTTSESTRATSHVSHTPSSVEVVGRAAPVLYELKKEIDRAEAKGVSRAA